MSQRRTPKEDSPIKDYWKDDDRFADFVNAVCFEGAQFVKPESLAGMDGVLDTSLWASAMQGIADVRR